MRTLGTLLTVLAATFALHAADASARAGVKPTIVLVHGAFADASGYGAVTDRLQDRGYTVISPANPLRGPASDAAYVASVMKTINGPIVLVAHSYGGAVITEAANEVANVKALVYLNALAMDAGESNLGSSSASRTGSPTRSCHGRSRCPTAPRAPTSTSTRPSFHSLFAPTSAPERPRGWPAPSVPCRWPALRRRSPSRPGRSIPSWYLIGRQDEVINPAAQRFMAKRAKAHTVEINSSHVSYISHPDAGHHPHPTRGAVRPALNVVP